MVGTIRTAAWVLGGLLLQACAVQHYPLQEPARPARALDAEVLARFDYAVIGSASLTPEWDDDEVQVSAGTLTVRMPAADGQASEDVDVEFEYWRAVQARDPAPAILVTPILGGGKRLARTNCRDFARAGFHVILAWRGTRIMRRGWPLEAIEVYMRRGVAARRALLDWAETRPEIDPGKMAAFGISMGGILTSVLLPVEPRLHSGVLCLAGGDLPDLIRHSSEDRLLRFMEFKQEVLKVDADEVVRRLRAVLPSDPLDLAQAIDPRQVLMVTTTRFDSAVPASNQERLWEALGRPTRYDIPTGHYTGVFYLPYITGVVVRWLERRFQGAAP